MKRTRGKRVNPAFADGGRALMTERPKDQSDNLMYDDYNFQFPIQTPLFLSPASLVGLVG
jgi:hypothetical protein